MNASLLRSSDIVDFGASEGATMLSPGKFVPVSCFDLLEKVKAGSVADPNAGILHGRNTVTKPPFYISLHNQSFDLLRWEIMEKGNYYETALTDAFQQVLKSSPPNTRVIDVGGNIGFFSLLSAATQRSVTIDTFEPNVKNRMRYCESQAMNRWFHTEFDGTSMYSARNPRLNLYHYGVGKKAGNFVFEENTNPGEGAFVEQKAYLGNGLQVITLDSFAKERGWFETRPDIAVLKVDVEGLEYSVIEGAKELLKAGIVRNLFLEVSAKSGEQARSNQPFIDFLSKETKYSLYMIGGVAGPDTKVDWGDDDKLYTRIVSTASKEPWKQLNLWYKLK